MRGCLVPEFLLGGEKTSDSEYTLKAEAIVLTEGLIKVCFQGFGPEQLGEEWCYLKTGGGVSGLGVRGRKASSVLAVPSLSCLWMSK